MDVWGFNHTKARIAKRLSGRKIHNDDGASGIWGMSRVSFNYTLACDKH
jgi:hypothetical protein